MASICIFGSFARGKFDELSDRDVLILGRSDDEINLPAARWRSDGWSVAQFKTQHFEDMAKRGSLFVQHILKEGVVIKDDGFLSEIRAAYRPKRYYRDEALDSLSLLANLPVAPACYWETLCAADIAYGAVRNLAILRLAESKRYEFEFEGALRHCAQVSRLSSEELAAVLRLRQLKHAYRMRKEDHSLLGCWPFALKAALRLFPCVPRSAATGGYVAVRMLELELVRIADPRLLDALSPDDPLTDIWTLICGPRYPTKIWEVPSSRFEEIRRAARQKSFDQTSVR